MDVGAGRRHPSDIEGAGSYIGAGIDLAPGDLGRPHRLVLVLRGTPTAQEIAVRKIEVAAAVGARVPSKRRGLIE